MNQGLQVARRGASARAFPWAPSDFEHVDRPRPARHGEIETAEISFSRLRTPAELCRVGHLRAEIQLPASALADPAFGTLEKKETKRVSSALSSGTAASSAR
jgi:hypothetical protein